jgi:hypothetical protein
MTDWMAEVIKEVSPAYLSFHHDFSFVFFL